MLRSAKLSAQEIERLRETLEERGIAASAPTNKYETLRVQFENIFLIAYSSGKLVYEDNPQTLKIISGVMQSARSEYEYELGSDEAGKGEWYGPLVVACVAVRPFDIGELRRAGVKDSKTLSAGTIKIIANEIRQNKKLAWSHVVLSPPDYNEQFARLKKEGKNLNDMLARAHARVIGETLEKLGNLDDAKILVTIDEFDKKKMGDGLKGLEKAKGVAIVQKTGGEEEMPVAAASILAKSFFEQEVDRLSSEFKVELKTASPQDIPKKDLHRVAKTHFRNVSGLL
ncbi:MAG: ribonuclease HIII [Nitrososphaera sp.]